MTQVQASQIGQGLGLFATQKYSAGDVILEEDPIFLFVPTLQEEILEIKSMFPPTKKNHHDMHDISSYLRSILPFSDQSLNHHRHPFQQLEGQFYGMILALVTFVAKYSHKNTNPNQNCESHMKSFLQHVHYNHNDMLELYTPLDTNTDTDSSTHEILQPLLPLAQKALQTLQQHASPHPSFLQDLLTNEPQICLRIMLVWACNSFEGGILFARISRVNHSCDPNVMIQPVPIQGESVPTKQSPYRHRLVACHDISLGQEMSLSYLGVFTFADWMTRQYYLRTMKYFSCTCPRCTLSMIPHPPKENHLTSLTTSASATFILHDMASCIPCSYCHPRIGKGKILLQEDVQYDDEDEDDEEEEDQNMDHNMNQKDTHTTHATKSDPSTGIHYHGRPSFASSSSQVHYAVPIVQVQANTHTDPTSTSNMDLQAYFCVSCGQETSFTTKENSPLQSKIHKVMERITSHLLSQASSSNQWDSHQKLGCEQQQQQQQQQPERISIQKDMTEQLFQLSSSVLGSRHWCTNLILLSHLDQMLSSFNAKILLSHVHESSSDHEDDDSLPDLIEIAECIDSLQKLWRYVHRLHVQMHPGHLLSKVTIGVARLLVSLGDAKSKKYGAEWIAKIEDYIHQGFEGQSMIRVVDSLRVAWQRDNNSKAPPNSTETAAPTSTTEETTIRSKRNSDEGDRDTDGTKKRKKIIL